MTTIINDVTIIFTNVQAKFKIEPDSTKTTRTQDVYLTIKLLTDDKRPPDMLDWSGSQQSIVNLAIRTGIKKILSIGGSGMLVIGEGLFVLDSENVNLLNDLFAYVQNEYDHCMIISNVPAVSSHYQDKLIVKRRVINKGTSYISNLANMQIPASILALFWIKPKQPK